MAIAKFDLNKALNSQDYAYACWKNYHNGNTMRISNSDYKILEKEYQNLLKNWIEKAEEDKNEYEIDDEPSSLNPKAQKIEKDQEKHLKQIERNKIKSGGNILGGFAAGITGGISGINLMFAPTLGNSIALTIACSMNLAIGILYHATKPNKKEKEALDLLKKLMLEAQKDIKEQMKNQEKYEQELKKIEEESNAEQESTIKDIEKTQEEKEICIVSYNLIVQRAEQEPISSSDRNRLIEIRGRLQDYNSSLAEKGDTLEASQKSAADEINDYQKNYNAVSSKLETAAKLAEISESFDEATKESCNVEKIAQSTNAASGLLNGTLATFAAALFRPWLAVAAAAGFTGAGLSSAGAAEQTKFEKEIDHTIKVRKDLQDLTHTGKTNLDLSIEKYVDQIEAIKTDVVTDEIEMPDDIKLEATPTPEVKTKNINNEEGVELKKKEK